MLTLYTLYSPDELCSTKGVVSGLLSSISILQNTASALKCTYKHTQIPTFSLISYFYPVNVCHIYQVPQAIDEQHAILLFHESCGILICKSMFNVRDYWSVTLFMALTGAISPLLSHAKWDNIVHLPLLIVLFYLTNQL